MRAGSRQLASTHDVHIALPGLVAFCVSIALTIDLVTLKLVGFDLAAYILAARRLLSGEPLYQSGLSALGPFGQYLYPPFVVVPFLPAAMVPFDIARGAGLLLLSAVAGLLLWYWVAPLPRASRYWGAAATTLFFPLIWEVTLENLTLISLALCVLAWRVRDRSAWSGGLLGVAIGLKLLPLLLIPFFLAARRWRVLAWSIVVLALIIAATWPIVGHEWAAYASLLTYIVNAPPGTGSNIVPILFASPALRLLLPTLAFAVAVMCGAVAARRDGREEAAFRVALAAVPLVASTLWYPYLVFALPLLVSSGARPSTFPLRVVLGAARPVSWVLMQWEALSDPGREFVLPFVGLLFLVAVGLLELTWGARHHAATVHAPRRETREATFV